MLTYVPDTSAILRFIDKEAGDERVRQLIQSSERGECLLKISAVNWGKITYPLVRRPSTSSAAEILENLLRVGLQVVSSTMAPAERAGLLKLKDKLSYADAFGVELASAPGHILVTADYGVKPAEAAIHIEFLPAKSQPRQAP